MKNKMIRKMLAMMIIGTMAGSMMACGSDATDTSTQVTYIATKDVSNEIETKNDVSSDNTSANNVSNEASTSEDYEMIGMPNPFVDYETLGEAIKAAGFSIEIPDAPSGYETVLYRVMNGEMIEVIWMSSDSEDETAVEAYRIRKEAGTGDISGDYNNYDEVEEVDVDGMTVTMKGNDGAVYVATWEFYGYTYALDIDMNGEGLSADSVVEIVSATK